MSNITNIASLQSVVFTKDHIENECQSMLDRENRRLLESKFTDFFNPNKSLLIRCLKNSKNISLIEEKSHCLWK